jgi:hypothetical protein
MACAGWLADNVREKNAPRRNTNKTAVPDPIAAPLMKIRLVNFLLSFFISLSFESEMVLWRKFVDIKNQSHYIHPARKQVTIGKN